MCRSRTVGSTRPTPPFQPDSVPPGATGPGAICIPGRCHRSFAEHLPREQLFSGIAPSGKRGLTVFRPLVLRWRACRGRRRARVRATVAAQPIAPLPSVTVTLVRPRGEFVSSVCPV